VIQEKKHYKLGIINCYWSVLGQKPA
jgi:hypothetical protein